MPISDAHAGRTYPPTPPVEITKGKIAEFAAALGDDSAAYRGDAPIAPPTFAAVLAAQAWEQLFSDSDLDLSLRRTIHYDQRFAFVRPMRAGDDITAQLTIEKVRSRGATSFITVSVAMTDAAGETVCTASSTLLHTAEASA